MSVRATMATAAVVNPTANTTKPATGAQVVSEISERGVICGIEQNGHHEECQRKLGRKRERRPYWKERQQRTTDRQENGIRCSDAARSSRQDYGGNEQTKNLFEFPHVIAHCPYCLDTRGSRSLDDLLDRQR